MRTIQIIETYRKNNRIYKYKISDNSIVYEIDSNNLKRLVRENKVQIDGYKLTSDNRLIQSNSIKYKKHDKNNIIYQLMHYDDVIGEFDSISWNLKITGNITLPYGFTTIYNWVESRSKFTCAKNVKSFLRSIGVEAPQDIIDITHCVSLQDVFWAKRKDDSISWSKVSPFRNDYSKYISTYGLEGLQIKSKDKNYMSPVVSTNGTFPHTWKKYNNDIYFIKAGTKYTLGGINSGQEPFSEYYVCKIAEFLNFEHVDYKIRYHKRQDNKTDIVTECKCYTTEKIGSVTAFNLKLNSYEKVIEFCKNLNKESLKTILDMLFLDCLTLNTDRHFENIEFLVNNATMEIIEIAPIYDNNYSLLPRFIETMDSFNRSDYRVRDGRTFEELYTLVKKYRTYTRELIKLKEFKFKAPQSVKITESRLKFLNDLLQLQVNYLLQQ